MRSFVAIVVGLAAASVLYLYQNPDLDLKVPEGLVTLLEEQGWLTSPGHRTNLLGKQYDHTGIGVSFGRWRGYSAVYVTQVFC